MRKHKIITKIIPVCLLFVLGGCNPLQIDPVNTVSDDQFWSNDELARAYVNDFYLWAPVTANQHFTAEMWSDNAVGNVETDWQTFRSDFMTLRNYTSWTLGTFTVVPWDNAYSHIRAINIALRELPGTGLDDARKSQLLGEAYFFRAWVYFELIQYLGGVPLVDKALTVDDETMIPRSSREASFDFVLGDLDAAIAQFKAAGTEPEKGYVGLNAAYTFKSRVALYAACAAEASEKGTYNSVITKEEERALMTFSKASSTYYQQAYDAAKEVYGKYSLEANYADLFNRTNNYESAEIIWPVMFKVGDDNRTGFNPGAVHGPYNIYYEYPGQNAQNTKLRGSAFPTQDLVDCYYQKDVADGVYKPWWKTRQVTDAMQGSVDADGNFHGKGENYRVMFEDRDPRFYATVVYDGETHRGHLVQTWVDTTAAPGVELTASSLHTGFRNTTLSTTTKALQAPSGQASCGTITSYYPAKYMPDNGNNEDGSINTNLVTLSYANLRYAEVILNMAEAAYKLNKSGETENLVNEIRDRAGIGHYNAAVAGHDIWAEYKMQRRIEFAFEVPSHRYYDLLRWGESDGLTTIPELNRYTKCLLVIRKGVDTKEYGVGKLGWPVTADHEDYFEPVIRTWRPEFQEWGNKFDDAKYYLMPFPKDMITGYRGLVQNPGWADVKIEM